MFDDWNENGLSSLNATTETLQDRTIAACREWKRIVEPIALLDKSKPEIYCEHNNRHRLLAVHDRRDCDWEVSASYKVMVGGWRNGCWFEDMSQARAMKAGSWPNENSSRSANVDDRTNTWCERGLLPVTLEAREKRKRNKDAWVLWGMKTWMRTYSNAVLTGTLADRNEKGLIIVAIMIMNRWSMRKKKFITVQRKMMGAWMLMMLNSWMQTMMNDVNRRTQVKNEMSYKKNAAVHARRVWPEPWDERKRHENLRIWRCQK